MKQYFLAFDYYNGEIDKSYFGIVSMNLKGKGVRDVCCNIIEEMHHDIKALDVTIKVTALNNIE